MRSGEVSWIQPKEKGTKPGPRSGHSITCTHEKAIVFGGCGVQGGKSAVFNETYILHIADQYRWEKVDAMGDLPNPRWRHTATTLPDNNSIFVFGGLCKGKRFNDSYIYDVFNPAARAYAWQAVEDGYIQPYDLRASCD